MKPNLERVGDMLVPTGDVYFVPRLQAGLLVEPETLQSALIHVRTRKRAIDVGAHIGCWTRELACLFGQVVAFEPHPENFAALSRNVARHDNVRCLPVALADRSTCSRMSHVGRVNSGEWTLEPEGEGPLVSVTSLDALALQDVGLIKIDVEGWEQPVVVGGEQTIRACRPVVILEEHFASPNHEAARELLQSWGAVEVFRLQSCDKAVDIVMAWPAAS